MDILMGKVNINYQMGRITKDVGFKIRKRVRGSKNNRMDQFTRVNS